MRGGRTPIQLYWACDLTLLGRAHPPISQMRRVKFRGLTLRLWHPGPVAGVPSRAQEAIKPLSSDTLEAQRRAAPGHPGLNAEGLGSILLKQESEKNASNSDDSSNL